MEPVARCRLEVAGGDLTRHGVRKTRIGDRPDVEAAEPGEQALEREGGGVGGLGVDDGVAAGGDPIDVAARAGLVLRAAAGDEGMCAGAEAEPGAGLPVGAVVLRDVPGARPRRDLVVGVAAGREQVARGEHHVGLQAVVGRWGLALADAQAEHGRRLDGERVERQVGRPIAVDDGAEIRDPLRERLAGQAVHEVDRRGAQTSVCWYHARNEGALHYS